MGRVRSKTVKKAARKLVEKYYNVLTRDFHMNKKLVDEFTLCPSKRMRNRVAGYATHLMNRIEKGQKVKGISLKIQEQEKERKLDFTPDVSEVEKIMRAGMKIKPETMSMCKKMGFKKLNNVEIVLPRKQRKQQGGYFAGNRQQQQTQQRNRRN